MEYNGKLKLDSIATGKSFTYNIPEYERGTINVRFNIRFESLMEEGEYQYVFENEYGTVISEGIARIGDYTSDPHYFNNGKKDNIFYGTK